MTNLASVADLQALMNRTFSDEDGSLAQANSVLTIISSWARVASGQEWPDAPAGVPQDVVSVVLTASRRDLGTVDGKSVLIDTMGPFGVTYGAAPEGFFSPAETAILSRFRRAGGLFTIGTTRGECFGAQAAGFVYDNENESGDPIAYYAAGEPGWAESYHVPER